jgi:MFS family permease
VRDLNVTDDEDKIGYYAGFLASTFAIAQFFTSLLWGYLSDKIGRRPVLMIGLLGNSLTVSAFGLSKTYTMAIVSRAFCGALNGEGNSDQYCVCDHRAKSMAAV